MERMHDQIQFCISSKSNVIFNVYSFPNEGVVIVHLSVKETYYVYHLKNVVRNCI